MLEQERGAEEVARGAWNGGAERGAIWLSPETRRVLEAMSDMFAALDSRLFIVFANRSAKEALEDRTGDPTGRSLFDLWPSLRGSKIEARLRTTMESGLPCQFEHQDLADSLWLEVDVHPNGDYLHVFVRDVSARRVAMGLRKERQRVIEKTLQALPLIAWATDAAGKNVYVNARWQEYTGSPIRTYGDVTAAIHPEDLHLLLAPNPAEEHGLECVLAPDRPNAVRVRLRRHDGVYRWHEVRTAPIGDGQGALHMIGTTTDVHEEHVARSALQEIAELQSFVFDSIPACLSYLDAEERFVATNANVAHWLRRPKHEILGRTLKELIGPEQYALRAEYMARALAGETIAFDCPVTLPSGHTIQTLSHYVPDIRDGKVKGLVAMIQDVTERKRADAALKASEMMAHSVIEMVAEGVIVIDASGKVLIENEASREYHRRGKHLPLQSINDFDRAIDIFDMDGQKLNVQDWPVARALRGETVRRKDLRIVWLDTNEEQWGSYSAAPLLGPEGEVRAALVSVFDITERVRREQELRDSKDRIEGVLASAEVATWSLDLERDLFLADANMANLIGEPDMPLQDLPLADCLERLHPEDRDRVREQLHSAHESGLPFETDFRVTTPTSERWVTCRGVPEVGPDGKTLRLTGALVDVTELKRAQVRDMELAERYQVFVESVPEMAWTAEPNGHIDYFNERWYEYTQSPRVRGQAGDWAPAVHPDDLEATHRVWQRSLETGKPYEKDLRLRNGRTGEYRWFLARARPLRDATGEIVRWFGMTVDIHEGKVKQQSMSFLAELAEAQRRLDDPSHVLLQASTLLGRYLKADRCAYSEVDLVKGTFMVSRDWSPDLPTFAGTHRISSFGDRIPQTQMQGETLVLRDVEMEEQDPRAVRHFKRMGVRALICVPVVKKGRLQAMLAVHQTTPRNWTEHEVELVEMVADRCWSSIQRARAERELREANAELEARVLQRTSDLQATNEQMQAFTYHVSHDLRGPLRAIVATSRIVQEDFGANLPPEAGALLERQSQAANRLGRLIDDLLKLSRLSREEMVRERVDFSAIAREAAEESLLDHPGTTVKVWVEDGLEALADPRLLRLALLNLIENAVKYSPCGGSVSVGRTSDGAFFVRDEGIGMEERYLEKIFEPFQRLHRDNEFRGTGIGLSNVRQVVIRHGGEIWVESCPGKGSTFTFTLPTRLEADSD